MIIEPAAKRDADAIAAFVNAAYRGTRAAMGWTYETDLLDGQRTDSAMVRAIIADRPGAILLLRLEAGADPIGCVAIAPTARVDVWSLGMLSVDPLRQAEGLGRCLIEAAETYAAGRQARVVTMTVIAGRNSLIANYERRGYAATGERAPFPHGDERFGRPRRDDLEFVVLARALAGSGSATVSAPPLQSGDSDARKGK